MEYESMELMELTLTGAKDERDLHALLAGVSDSCIHQTKDEAYWPARDGDMINGHPHTDYEINDVPVSNKGECLPKGHRGQRKRSNSAWRAEASRLFGLQRSVRTNNPWTTFEVNQLVDGVSTLGVGKWAELKNAYFSASIRTQEHLKDKWRNLLRACGIQVGTKKKVKAYKATHEIVQTLEERIIAIYMNHGTKKRGASGV